MTDRKQRDRCRDQAERADPSGESAVQRDEIDEKRDERPDFLGVPSPESAPGIVGPDTAQDRTGGDQEHADLHRPVDEVGKRLDGRDGLLHGPAARVELDLAVPFFVGLQLGPQGEKSFDSSTSPPIARRPVSATASPSKAMPANR